MMKSYSGKSYLFGLLLVLAGFGSKAQLTIVDTGNCVNHVLHATVTGTMPTGTGITSDDAYSGVFPLGFSFDFYGTSYTQCIIGSNGMISFNLASAGAYCPWPISAALLGNPSARNCVCGPWCDILISAGGSITYSTAGVAPNRKFAVTWCGAGMFSCTTQWTTSQIILYETSNIVEVHTAHKTICAWNSGRAITGVQNATGTAATAAPGRDWTPSWSVTSPPEAWRFSPTSPSAYSVASIPYAPMPYATSAVYWYDSTTGAYLGSGPYLTVSPTVPTTYKAAALGCNDTTTAYMLVYPPSAGIGGIPHIDTYDYWHPSECGKCDGKIVLRGVNPHQIDTVFWSFNGVPQPSYVDSAALDSTITLSNLCGGVYDYIYVKVANCPSNQVGPITLVTPVLAISSIDISHPTVCGKNDGYITLHGLTPLKPVSVAYNRAGVPQPPVTGIVAADSSFVVPGLDAGTYSGIAATINLCTAPGNPVNLIDPPPPPASFTFDLGLGCTGDTVFVTNTSAPTGYFSYWEFDTPSALDSTHTWHVYPTHTLSPRYQASYTITLHYNTTGFHKANCDATHTETIDIDHRVQSMFTAKYDSICKNVDEEFTNSSLCILPPDYHWEFGNGAVADGDFEPTYSWAVGGPYQVSLKVTDSLGCYDISTKVIEVVDLNITTNVIDTDVCLRIPMPLEVTADLVPDLAVSYAWTQSPSGSNLDAYDVHNPYFNGIGNYKLTVIANTQPFGLFPTGCADTANITIRSHPPLQLVNVTASPQVIKLGNSLQLNADGAEFYTWMPNNGTLNNYNINNPIATPKDSNTVYTVYGMNHWGCKDTVNVVVRVDQEVHDFVPSAFTPNGDGTNDVFRVMSLKFVKLVDFRVYNRWGQLVFQTSNPEMGWDGTFNGEPQDMGTYLYEIIVADPNGINKIHKGNVTLIR